MQRNNIGYFSFNKFQFTPHENEELTAAYAAIANKGTYTKPIYYTKVLDREGNVIIDNSIPETHRVLKESSAWLLTSGMESVVNSGTATRAKLSNQPVAGKTGTTQFALGEANLWILQSLF